MGWLKSKREAPVFTLVRIKGFTQFALYSLSSSLVPFRLWAFVFGAVMVLK